MKKRIIFVLLAVLTVSFSSIGFAAKKAAAKAEVTKKEAAKPAATVNPLLGKWSFSSQNVFFVITFTADTATFNVRNGESYSEMANDVMKYKFSKSPIILEHKTPEGKTIKLSMKYTIKGDKLTYRFLNMNNKPIPGIFEEFSMTRSSRTAKPKDADIVAEKRGGSTEETSAVEEQKSEETSDKPAVAETPLSGKWSFMGRMMLYEVTFDADTAIFNMRNIESYKSEKVEMKYKFSKSPLILEHKTPEGKTVKLTMKYTIKGDKLTYRFLNTKNKPIPGLDTGFSMTQTANAKDTDIVLEKQ